MQHTKRRLEQFLLETEGEIKSIVNDMSISEEMKKEAVAALQRLIDIDKQALQELEQLSEESEQKWKDFFDSQIAQGKKLKGYNDRFEPIFED